MADNPTTQSRRALAIPGNWLLAALFACFAGGQLLLLAFLGLTHPALWIAASLLTVLLILLVARSESALPPVPLQRLTLLFGFALILYALGGEGRFFYANIDWQVRDAAMRDMIVNPWPFAYQADGRPLELLRAPIGMFLLPALGGKLGGIRAGELVLLVQNAMMLAILLSLGSSLFASSRQRIIALLLLTFFSGSDILLNIAVHGVPQDHLEFTLPGLQYSSHVTQAFWVPQHALAGWVGALLLLLWHRKLIPLWPMLALLPLTALWSPLPLIGMMPFAAFAGISALRSGGLRIADFALPALAVLLAFPALVYLAAAPDVVGFHLIGQPWPNWFVFVLSECLIFAVPLLLARREADWPLIALAALLLLILPFGQIGWSSDFVMRASIPALLILAFAATEALITGGLPVRYRVWLGLAFAFGSLTGGHEIARALTNPPSPRGACSIFGVWNISFGQYPKGSYLAPLDQVPALVRPVHPALVPIHDPQPCWTGPWLRPSGV